MKKVAILLGFIMVGLFKVEAQQTEERKLPAFDKVNVSCEASVYMSKGTDEKVKIVANGIDLSDVSIKVDGKTLIIELSRGIHTGANVEVYLTYKEVREISVGASGNVSVQDTLSGDKVVLNAISNGELDTELNLKTVDINVQGGIIRLKGRAGSMDAKVSMKGILSAFEFQSDSTYIKVSSAGNAKVRANILLNADVRSGGNLTYTGSPKQNNIKSGLGATVNSIEE